MNNDQFRKLVAANAAKPSKDGPSPPSATPGGSALGSRQRASIPMTPRAVGGATQADFARQLADRNRANRPQQKKFRSSAPKGAKVAEGYLDRSAARGQDAAADDDRAERLKALEELLKKEEIDQATFEKLRFEIAGGDLESTHLVKGLDFKLLERIRKGEDVYGEAKETPDVEGDVEPEEDVDDAFEQLERQEVEAVAKEKSEKKKGEVSTVRLAPGQKRTRDQVLADLKASRAAAKAAQQESALGDRFRKIGDPKKAGSRIERDSKGREVLIIVDEDGHEKRKVRKARPEDEQAGSARDELLMPDKDAAPLGMEVPEQYRKTNETEEEDEDVDIFEGVGDDYDPLAGMDDDSDSDSDADEEKEKRAVAPQSTLGETQTAKERSDKEAMPPPPVLLPPKTTAPKPNYFQGAKTGLVSEEEAPKAPSMNDPAIQAAFKRAAALKKREEETEDDDYDEDGQAVDRQKKREREERHREMLRGGVDRDDEDMDLGFGTSRFEDEEDFDDGSNKVKLSNWGGDDDGDEGHQGKGAKRKRGPKKRKGDAKNAADVMRVMESRKKE